MIDAEQNYFQPAINRMAVEMMRKFNRDKVVIMNTYQCYLKNTEEELLVDLASAERENFHFGCKLVRGAYISHQRERCEHLCSHINLNYYSNLKLLIKSMRDTNKTSVMVASHNEDSVKYALELLDKYNISPEASELYFGQLLGMCDHVTFPLDHKLFKYVPYGPVKEVLPYLHRKIRPCWVAGRNWKEK